MISFLEAVKNYGDIGASAAILNDGYRELGITRDHTGAQALEALGEQPDEVSLSQRSLKLARNLGYQRRLFEAQKIILRGITGSRRDRFNLQEALATSDFQNLFGDIIDRAVLANYLETPYTWNMIAASSEVSDFRPVKRFRVDGGTGLLANTALNPTANLTGTSAKGAGFDSNGNMLPITQGAQYPEASLTDGLYEYRLAKYGSRMPFFWETLVNDDLNAIKDTPARFGRGARRSEEYFVTKMFANNVSGTLGPNGNYFYSNGNKNIVNAANAGGAFTTNNPALSITALQQAMVVMMNQLDTTGQPISVEAVTLVVPPALKTVAMNILNADYVWMGDQGGTNGGANNFPLQQIHVANWAKNIVRLAVNYYLPLCDKTYGQTGWYLFSNPENGRPALEFGRLRGRTMPELFMKLPNSVAISEGTMGPGPGIAPGTTNMNPLEGDFDTDSINYKIRHVFGGTQIDPIMTVFSNGSGV